MLKKVAFIIIQFLLFSAIIHAQPVDPPAEPGGSWFDWLTENWLEVVGILSALLVMLETIVRLTPTKKDDAWFNWLRKIIDVILPNRKSGGGTHSR